MPKDKKVVSQADIKHLIKRLARAILSHNKNHSSLVLIGIHNRGVPLARRLQAELKKTIKRTVPLGTLDITLYRDDLDTVGQAPIVKATRINFDLTDKNTILVDDVLFTGRTIRAALNELADFGRPKSIQLAVLIDRGHHELPIRPDYLGKAVKTKDSEIVRVCLKETDGRDEVLISERTNG